MLHTLRRHDGGEWCSRWYVGQFSPPSGTPCGPRWSSFRTRLEKDALNGATVGGWQVGPLYYCRCIECPRKSLIDVDPQELGDWRQAQPLLCWSRWGVKALLKMFDLWPPSIHCCYVMCRVKQLVELVLQPGAMKLLQKRKKVEQDDVIKRVSVKPQAVSCSNLRNITVSSWLRLICWCFMFYVTLQSEYSEDTSIYYFYFCIIKESEQNGGTLIYTLPWLPSYAA